MGTNNMTSSMTEAEATRVTANLVDLLGTVSHELRSPLATIKGYAATLLRHGQRLPQEEQREFIEIIHRASEQLESVVDRLMEMAQLEVAAPELIHQPVNILAVALESVESAKRAIARSGRQLALTFLADPSLLVPTWVEGDERRLRLVIDHLLANAINFTPDGGYISVTLAPGPDAGSATGPLARRLPDASSTVEFVVRDSGRGIPPEELQLIFERFHRVDMRLTRDVNGLGLGLAICKCIVTLHGGAIWAESTVGEGSAFHVLLPGAATTAAGATATDATTV